MIAFILSSIMAGLFIGIGADLQCMALANGFNPYLAALLFSFGLCAVRFCEVPLYTGKVGTYIEDVQPLRNAVRLVFMFCWNAIGAGLATLLPWSCDWCKGLSSYEGWGVLLPAMLCGALVHVATRQYRCYLATILCVVAFIVAGGQHCIANAYHLVKLGITLDGVAFLFKCALGNALGAWLAWGVSELEY